MSEEITYKHWSSELLTLLGIWLWEQGEYGHALLCITGPQWGFKMSTQLKICWNDVVDFEDYFVKSEFYFEDENTTRQITGLAYKYIELAGDIVDIDYVEDSMYKNYKTGKLLSTSTLNRELQKFSEAFLADLEERTGKVFSLKPLKSNAFQIACMMKQLQKYHYSKRCFVSVSKFMGHRTLKDTIKLLEVEPFDTIVYDFNGFSESSNINANLIEDKNELTKFVEQATFDHWSFLKESTIPL